MTATHMSMLGKHILGRRTRVAAVRGDASDDRRWLARSPVCTALAEHRIAHCGIMNAAHPMEVLRPELSGTFFLACTQGAGDVLIDGRWSPVVEGQACLQPPMIPNGLRARRRGSWRFGWVRYHELQRGQAIATMHSPVITEFDAKGFTFALEGLRAEASGPASESALRHWASLIHGYVLSFAQPYRGDDRLQRVWRAVQRRLDREWDVAELASLACVSKEHLRRLTLQSLGRSPMQHVTYMRMLHAADLLDTTTDKVAHVARRVGYATPFSFSNTFLRWTGLRPSDYRDRRRAES